MSEIQFETIQATVAKFDPKPGDTLILTIPDKLSPARSEAARRAIENAFPFKRLKCKLLVLHSGMTLSVMPRPADGEHQ